MLNNVGTIDRIIRVLVGVGLLGWGFYAENWLGAIGIVPLLTAATSSCLLYMPLGLNTNPTVNK